MIRTPARFAVCTTLLALAACSQRDAAEQQLGEQFDIRAIHDVVLTNGSIPLPVLETVIQSWVAEKKAQAQK